MDRARLAMILWVLLTLLVMGWVVFVYVPPP